MAKTPSPKVIACYLLREALGNVPNNTSAEDLTSLVDSRVNDAKAEKVFDQFDKVTASLKKKITAVISKFETPSSPTGKSSSAKAPTKGGRPDKKKGKKPDKKHGTRSMASMFDVDD